MWPSAGRIEGDQLVRFVNDWTLVRLRKLNEAILAGSSKPEELLRELNETVLPRLPDDLSSFGPDRAGRLLVHLGLLGASVAKHMQQRHPYLRAQPAQSLSVLVTGERRRAFLRFFWELADVSATGHPHRDAYASLVRWNVPTVRVQWAGQRLAVVEGAFSENTVRTYTSAAGEAVFLTMLKKCEAVELAANDLLEPIAAGRISPAAAEARERVRAATGMLGVVRRLLLGFTDDLVRERFGGRNPAEAVDRFAVHWQSEDVPPSCMQGVEYVRRDLLLGVNVPGYHDHVRRLFPGLLAAERATLTELMERPSLPEQVLRTAGLRHTSLAPCSVDRLHMSVATHPWLLDYFLLFRMNAEAGAVHLAMTEKLAADRELVEEAVGEQREQVTTNGANRSGRDERLLARLSFARGQSPLAGAQPGSLREIFSATNASPDWAGISGAELEEVVRIS